MKAECEVSFVAIRQLLMQFPDDEPGVPYEVFWLHLPNVNSEVLKHVELRRLDLSIPVEVMSLRKRSDMDIQSLGLVEYCEPNELPGPREREVTRVLLYALELEPGVEHNQTKLPEHTYSRAVRVNFPLSSDLPLSSKLDAEEQAVLREIDKWLWWSRSFHGLGARMQVATEVGPSPHKP